MPNGRRNVGPRAQLAGAVTTGDRISVRSFLARPIISITSSLPILFQRQLVKKSGRNGGHQTPANVSTYAHREPDAKLCREMIDWLMIRKIPCKMTAALRRNKKTAQTPPTRIRCLVLVATHTLLQIGVLYVRYHQLNGITWHQSRVLCCFHWRVRADTKYIL